MKKYITLALVFICALTLVSCMGQKVVLDEVKVYEITFDNIHSLDIDITAADFTIEHGDRFSVESNLKYLSVSVKDGVLTIADESKRNSDYSDALLTLCIPEGTVFDEADIRTGAAKLYADSLSASTLKLELGAGDVRFESLNAFTRADIEGGAGDFSVMSGTLNDLSLELGAGRLNMTAALHGESDLEFGVGKCDLTLIGSKEDYKLDIKRGVGSITVDGKNYSDFQNSENALHFVNIQGGMGSASVSFDEE